MGGKGATSNINYYYHYPAHADEPASATLVIRETLQLALRYRDTDRMVPQRGGLHPQEGEADWVSGSGYPPGQYPPPPPPPPAGQFLAVLPSPLLLNSFKAVNLTCLNFGAEYPL